MAQQRKPRTEISVLADFRRRWHREPAGLEAARIADAVAFLAGLDAQYLPIGAAAAIRVVAEATPAGIHAYASLVDDVLAAEATR